MILWRNDGRSTWGRVFTFIFLSLLCGCEGVELGPLSTFSSAPEAGGIVVADDPQAVIMAQQVLDGGGTAADAAVALGFGLAVTLPSSAGLGGGGACIVYDFDTRRAEYLDFKPEPAIENLEHARWHISIPALAGGLFALHAKHGALPWAQVVSPAETYSRFNRTVGRALAKDIEKHSGTLSTDPVALDIFMPSTRTLAGEGASILQINLASTLGRIREKSAADFYQGDLASDIIQASEVIGASLGMSDLKGFRPHWTPLSGEELNGAMLYTVSESETVKRSAELSVAERENQNGAATGFAIADAAGNAVVCQLTMTTPFGLGLILNEVGFLAAPDKGKLIETNSTLPPMVIAVDEHNERLAFAGVSKELQGAGVLMTALAQSLSSKSVFQITSQQTAVQEQSVYPGVNMLHCKNGLGPSFVTCEVHKDPTGYGHGIISFGEP